MADTNTAPGETGVADAAATEFFISKWQGTTASEYLTLTKSFVARAQELFDSGDPAKLLYAALEVRMGTEARLQSYVHAHNQISAKSRMAGKSRSLPTAWPSTSIKTILLLT